MPVLGSVSGPELTTSVLSYDFDVVSVGCTATLPLELTNSGTEELVIDELTLTNGLEFMLVDDRTGAGPVLPIRIGAAASVTIDVVYVPSAEHTTSTTIQIKSDDAITPTTNVNVDAEGRIEASNTLYWTVEGQQAVTGIINVNEYVTNGPFSARLDDFVPEFFEALHDSNASFRVAMVMHEDGHVSGDIPYIDDSFTVDEAVAAAEEMLDGPSLYGDNDSGLQTCFNAIEENESWLLDEPGSLWAESKLNLVVVNSDVEQSPGDADHYMDLYDDFKDEKTSIAVHGIAGDYPGGCGGPGGSAEPSQNLWNAAEVSGGVFISICDSDWTKTATTLAEAFTGDVQTFLLEDNPAPATIEVYIDGAQVFTGWSYDEKTKAVEFDFTTYPTRGAQLRIYYLMAVSCD